MSNNSSAAAPQPQIQTPTQNPSAPTVQTTPPAEKAAPVQNSAETVAHATVTTQELLAQLNKFSSDKELWHLVYMVHDPDFFALRKEQDVAGKIRIRYSPLCADDERISRLESISKCNAYRKSNDDFYLYTCRTDDNRTPTYKCAYCSDDLPFCIPRMNAYIQYHCQKNGIDPEEIYRNILGEDFKPKAAAQTLEYQIPPEEYDFLDSSCTIAASELIKMNWIHLKPSADDRICYTYLPVCEHTTRSFVTPALEFYRNHSGKHDFIRKDQIRQELCDNRQCANCMFSQCPDKVAAYILTLADKYGAEPLSLIQYIVTTNKIRSVSLRGNFRYHETLRKLDNISFTSESRIQLNKILKYMINNLDNPKDKYPLLPFHLALYTKDEQLADETAKIFRDAVWYYAYMKDCQSLQEYRFSQGGLSGLIEYIEKLDKPTVLHIKEFSLLGSENSMQQNHSLQMTRLNNLIQIKQSKLFIVISGEKAKMDTALGVFSDFYHGTIQYHLTISDMPTSKILDAVLNTLQKNYKLEDGFSRELEYYIISQYAESPLRSKAFVDFTVQTILFNHFSNEFASGDTLRVRDIPLSVNRRSDEDIWHDLEELTGLENVKEEIRSLEQLLKFQKKMQSLGIQKSQRPNLHMIFSGNPGTGKTTVARLIAELLYNVGYIRQNKLVEASPKDLIGQYIGQTAPKTAAICESAYDGVLFIDEAYELTVHPGDHNSNFRSECITELIKQMEDNRDKLVVIFAGYTQQMQELLDSNPGFASRISRTIPFTDYSEQQLVDMFVNQVRKNGMSVQDDALQAVSQAIRFAKELPNFGNARYVRNLYEKAIQQHAKNTVFSEDPDVLTQLSVQDIPLV